MEIDSQIKEDTTDMLWVTVMDGKYTVKQDRHGRLSALRYGSPWRDCCGDGLIHALAWEVKELREKLEKINIISEMN